MTQRGALSCMHAGGTAACAHHPAQLPGSSLARPLLRLCTGFAIHSRGQGSHGPEAASSLVTMATPLLQLAGDNRSLHRLSACSVARQLHTVLSTGLSVALH